MNIFDILGPVMIGPSSSHTAGAVKLGYVARKLLGGEPVTAKVYLHGSFADTGKGHGTDRAIIAGILGMKEDDERIPASFELAQERGLIFQIENIELPGAHPNTAVMELTDTGGRKIEVQGASVGGSRIVINKIDGAEVECTAEYPTLIVYNKDLPGYVAEVTSALAARAINIATMRLFRGKRGTEAVMIIESDQAIPREIIDRLEKIDGILKVTYIASL
ncbi:L-serine ammonia-lyase, iron-sulfur-dependent, subunit beta [Lachnospiraceae bacterium oral taxon 500]|nr:L-serine ammonia-lyase, iron-sulfur-dependent, subunit beta [Lachnospiraceae bacterium oral taxon 500]